VADYVLNTQPAIVNLSPVAFRLAARDYFKCFLDFEKPGRFSVVPYFLCRRAIELGLKAVHLQTRSQKDVKYAYGHDLVKAYRDLPKEQQTLSGDEVDVLEKVNSIYSKKDFEYMRAEDAAHGCSRYPDLDALASLARKMADYDTGSSGKTPEEKTQPSVPTTSGTPGFPAFIRNPLNHIARSSQFTDDIEGYVFDGADGSQVAFWTCSEDRVSAEHAHEFDEYVLVVDGQATIITGHQRTVLTAGQEMVISRGTRQQMAVTAGTRTIHVFGGKRARREGEP
jgi:quercetin dioxygenase-like cupin family protein